MERKWIRKKRLISEREEKLIVRTVKRQRTISSQDIKEFTKVNASAKTVKRILHKYGYASRIRRNHLSVRRIEKQNYHLKLMIEKSIMVG